MSDNVKIRVILRDNEEPETIEVPKDASRRDILRIIEEEQKLRNQPVVEEVEENTNVDTLRNFVSNLYDPQNVESDLAKGTLSLAQAPLDLFGMILDPAIRLGGKLTNTNPATFSDMSQAIYEPQNKQDQLNNSIIRSLGSFGTGLLGASKYIPKAIDKPVRTGLNRFFTDDPVVGSIIAGTVPATSYLATEVSGSKGFGDTLGFGQGILTSMFGRPVIRRTPALKDIDDNIAKKENFDFREIAQESQNKLDEAKKLSKNLYDQAQFTGLKFDNNDSRNIIDETINNLTVKDLSTKEMPSDDPYLAALNYLNKFKRKYDGDATEKMSLNDLTSIEGQLERFREGIKPGTPQHETILKAIKSVREQIRTEKTPLYAYSEDGVLLPDNNQTRKLKNDARRAYQQESYLSNLTEIIDKIQAEQDIKDFSATKLKDKVKVELKKRFIDNKQNRNFLSSEQESKIKEVINSKTPYKGLFDLVTKGTKDLQSFLLLLQSSPKMALAQFGLKTATTSLQDSMNEKELGQLLRSLSGPINDVDASNINPKVPSRFAPSIAQTLRAIEQQRQRNEEFYP
jgi:hypothetical protein